MRASSKLSTPLSSSSPEPSLFRGGLILFWVAFAGYLTLITPGIYWRDAGELTASAFGLGVAHPTGFSAYVIMAKLATFVPLGSIAFRVNLLSSVCGGAAVSLAYVLMVRFAGDRTRMTRWSAGAGALLLAWGSTFWLHSTTAEVYAPNLLVTLALIWYGLEVIERGSHTATRAMAVLTGLGIGLHSSIALSAGAVWLVVLAWHWTRPGDRGPRIGRDLAWSAALGLTAALVVAYLPIRAAADPWRNWGHPDTLSAVWSHISGARIREAFGGSMVSGSAVGPNLGEAALQLADQVSWTGFLAILGMLVLGLSRPIHAGMLLLLWVGDLFFTVMLNPMGMVDHQTGLLTTTVTVIAAASGVAWIGRKFTGHHFKEPLASLVIWVGFVGLAMPAMVSNGGVRNTRSLYHPMDQADDAFDNSPPRTLLLVASDDIASATTYAQGVENRRPDCTTVVRQHIFDADYIGKLRRAHGPEHLTDGFMTSLQAGMGPLELIDRLVAENTERRPILWEIGDVITDARVRDQLRVDFPLARLNYGPVIRNLTTRLISYRMRWRKLSGRHWPSSALIMLARKYALAGATLLQRGEMFRAKMAIHDAMMTYRDDPQVVNNYAITLQAEGHHEKARRRFEEVVARRPSYALGWYNLGMACFNTGELTCVQEAWTEAARLGLTPQRAAKAAYRLAILQANEKRFAHSYLLLLRSLDGLPPSDRVNAEAMEVKLRALVFER